MARRPVLLRLPISHYCHKVEWALQDLGIDVDACHIWFRDLIDIQEINPENTVPVLELDDRLVCGSHAILEWAAEATGADLWPSDDVRAWEAWADETVGPLARRDAYRTVYERPLSYSRNPAIWVAGLLGRRLVLGVLKTIKARRDYAADDRDRAEVLSRIGTRLRASAGPFLFGDEKTAADYATAALLRPLLRVRLKSHTGHADWRLLRQYIRRVRPRGSPIRKRSRFTPDVRARMASKASA